MVLDLIESSRIEFKVKMVDNLEETIIAFLNSKDGGILPESLISTKSKPA